jgi:hypothetical protein
MITLDPPHPCKENKSNGHIEMSDRVRVVLDVGKSSKVRCGEWRSSAQEAATINANSDRVKKQRKQMLIICNKKEEELD